MADAKNRILNNIDMKLVDLGDGTYGQAVVGANADGSIGSKGKTTTITRPSDTTAYTAGDVVGDTNGSGIFELTNVGVAGSEVFLRSVELIIAVASVPASMSTFQMYLFNAAPTAHADNAPLALAAGDATKYLKDFTLVTPVDKGGFLASINESVDQQITLLTTSLFFMITTAGAYTPTSAAVKYVKTHFLAI